MSINLQILINKENPLNKYFVPHDLISTDDNKDNFHNYTDSNQKPTISLQVYEKFLQLKKIASMYNYNILIDSGFRSYEYQKIIYDKSLEEKGYEYTSKMVALPGSSEHQSGLACDIACIKNGKYTDDISQEEELINFLMHNAHYFGFILRYPKGKEDITGINFEPWHYRYVGVEAATEMYYNELVLEEYLEIKKVKTR